MSLTKTLLLPFIGLAAVGLVLSMLVHLSALFGQPIPLGRKVWGLHFGIFAVWIPAVIVTTLSSRGVVRKDFWKFALRGCPEWFRYLTYGLFGYSLVNFAIFLFKTAKVSRGEPPSEEVKLIGFSGHWMVFYAAALGLLWSFVRAGENQAPRCPNGHPVGAEAKFCAECGSHVQGIQQGPP